MNLLRGYLLIFIALLCSPACKERELIFGEVVNVADGDTFTMINSKKDRIKVRLYGIDAPERGQGFSNAAKQFLSTLVMHKNVNIKIVNVDQYKRIVGIVLLGEVNIHEALLRNGYAWHYTAFDQNVQWSAMEKKARLAKKGLWVDPHAEPPWRFRKNRRALSK